eukprot:1332038-Amorphochlora_amoeboformis.AAC.2
MKSVFSRLLAILSFFFVVGVSHGGPVAVGLCYTACNAAYCSCMASSGLVAGTTGPVGWYAWITGAAGACSAAQSVCMVSCASLAAAPTP